MLVSPNSHWFVRHMPCTFSLASGQRRTHITDISQGSANPPRYSVYMWPVAHTGLWTIASIRLLGLSFCTIKPCHSAQVLPQLSGRHSQGSNSLDSFTNKARVIVELKGITHKNEGFLPISIKSFLSVVGKLIGLAQAVVYQVSHISDINSKQKMWGITRLHPHWQLWKILRSATTIL